MSIQCLINGFLIFLVCLASGTCFASESIEKISVGNLLVFKTKSGQQERTIIEMSQSSYKFRNKSGNQIESLLGVVNINWDASQGIDEAQRQKVNPKDFAIGKKIIFNHYGNSGSGNWIRTVSIDVTSQETFSFNGKPVQTLLLNGGVNAPRTYDLKFQCWYSVELGLCLKMVTKTQSLRNPELNGEDNIELIEIKR
jgi:hypothetical protein